MKNILLAILKRLEITRYRLSQSTGISEQVLRSWIVRDATTVKLSHLSKLRKYSGLTWNQLGELIDKESAE